MSLYRRALSFVTPYWRKLSLVLAISMVATLAGLAQPYLLKVLIDDAFLNRDFGALVRVALALALLAIGSFVLNALSSYRYVEVSAEALFDMRLAVYRHLQKLSPRFYARTPTGEILSRLNNDVSEIQRVASDTLLAVLTNAAFLAGTVAILYALDKKLFLLSLALVPLALFLMHRSRRRVTDENRVVRERSAEIGSFLVESLLGLRHTVGARQEAREAERFREKNSRFISALLKLQLTNAFAAGLPGALVSLSTLIVFLVGGRAVLQGTLSVGGFVAFAAYQARLLGPIQNLMSLFLNLQGARASLERVFQILDEKPEVEDSPGSRRLEEVRGEIELRDVVLGFDRESPVLDGVSFRVPAGATYAVVGPSGGGKSTMADLLVRFVDPLRGEVRIDGVDLREVELASLRDHVVVMDQETFLWNATIEDNIRYARPAATAAEVAAVVHAAQLDAFVAALPKGLATPVGERGHELSAGERQRVALARVLLRRPAVLVLDEATSALDGDAERSFADALAPFMKGRTTLVLSHRLALVAKADRVLVLEGGRIVESGTAEELFRRRGSFARLFSARADISA